MDTDSRQAFYQKVVDKTLDSSGLPVILHGKPGQGKSTTLKKIIPKIQSQSQAIQVYFPFDQICYSPQFFDQHSIKIVQNSLSANTEGLAEEFTNEVNNYVEKDLRAFAALEKVCIHNNIQVVVLIDELFDLTVFKSYPGYKDIIRFFITRYLVDGYMDCIATTAFDRRLDEEWRSTGRQNPVKLEVPAFEEEEITHLVCQQGLLQMADISREIFILTGGNQGYVKAFVDHAHTWNKAVNLDLIVTSLHRDAPVEMKCRFNYEYLVAKSRGEGIIRHLMAVISHLDYPNLTEIARHMNRSLGVTKDYLKWMMAVGILDVEKKRYSMPDKLLRLWVQLFRSGTHSNNNKVKTAVAELLDTGYKQLKNKKIDYESIKASYQNESEEIKLPGFN